MSAKKAKLDLFIKVRCYPGNAYWSVWLCHLDGPAESGLLWGELTPPLAELLIEKLGLRVEREESPLALKPLESPGCVPVAKQGDLFGPEKKE